MSPKLVRLPLCAALFALAPPAWAFDRIDVGANDSCASGESFDGDLHGQGHLDSADDQDWYCFTPPVSGTISARLQDWAFEDNSFDIQLQAGCGGSAVATSAGDQHLTLDAGLAAGESACLGVQASSWDPDGDGRYALGISFDADPPVISSHTMTGPVGGLVTISGSNFDPTPGRYGVSFAGADAWVESSSTTGLVVKAPVFGESGTIFLTGGPDVGSFTYAGLPPATRPASSLPTAPDSDATLLLASGLEVSTERFYVDFRGHIRAVQVASLLDDFVAGEADIDGYSLGAVFFDTNSWAVDLDWLTPPTEARWLELEAALLALIPVEFVGISATNGTSLPGIGQPTDIHAIGAASRSSGGIGWQLAAWRQIAAEEAWRSYRTWPIEPEEAEPVDIVVIDSGLLDGDFDGFGEQFTGIGGSGIELHVWRTTDGNSWSDSLGFDDPTVTPPFSTQPSHGTHVASLIAASNDGAVPLDEGVETPDNLGTNGILSGFDHVVAGPPAVRLHVIVAGLASAGDRPPVDHVIVNHALRALQSRRFLFDDHDGYLDPEILSLSLFNPDATDVRSMLTPLNPSFARQRLWVVAAGNSGGANSNQLVQRLITQAGADRVIAVGGSAARAVFGTDALPDTRGKVAGAQSDYGSWINVVAPWDGWHLAEAVRGSGSITYTHGDPTGTSFSAPAVAAGAAFLLSVDPDRPPAWVKQQLEALGTDVQESWYQNTRPSLPGRGAPTAKSRLDLGNVVASSLNMVDADGDDVGDLDRNVYVYAIDEGGGSSPARLHRRPYHPSGDGLTIDAGDSAGSSLSTNLEEDGCTTPQSVRVDPRGDVVYVICDDDLATTWQVHAYTAVRQRVDGVLDDEASFVHLGSVDITGEVANRGELAIGSDGVLHLPSTVDAGLELQGIDGFHGQPALPPLDLLDDDPDSRLHGMADVVVATEVDADGNIFLAATTGVLAEDGDTLGRFARPSLSDRAYGLADEFDFADEGLTFGLSDVGIGPDGTVYLPFQTVATDSSQTELVSLMDWPGLSASAVTHQLDDANQPIAATPSPIADDASLWLADLQDAAGDPHLLRLDTDDIAAGDAHLAADLCTWSSIDPLPKEVELADNGRFAAVLWDSSYGGLANVLTIDGPPPSCSYATAVHSGGYLREGQGVAITPTLSVLSPRPGNLIDGMRRIVVAVRDDNYDHLEFQLQDEGGSPVATDVTEACGDDWELADGLSTGCTIEGLALSPGSYRLTISAWYGDGSPGAIVHAWYERP